MFDTRRKIEAARREAEQIFAEGMARKLPIIISYMAVKGMMKTFDLPIPEDILNWTYGPNYSDRQITDPLAVYGGE